MTEKITRAQAEAALTALVRDTEGTYSDQQCESCGASVWWDLTRPVICGECSGSTLRAYLAQQPSDDVVRKAHGALDTMHEKWCNCCSECQTEGGPLAEAILAALPPMPEEK